MPPPIPCATYRLQLAPSFGFEEAAASYPISNPLESPMYTPHPSSNRAPAARTATTSSTIV